MSTELRHQTARLPHQLHVVQCPQKSKFSISEFVDIGLPANTWDRARSPPIKLRCNCSSINYKQGNCTIRAPPGITDGDTWAEVTTHNSGVVKSQLKFLHKRQLLHVLEQTQVCLSCCEDLNLLGSNEQEGGCMGFFLHQRS